MSAVIASGDAGLGAKAPARGAVNELGASRRSLLALTGGALLGLTLAGYALFTATGTSLHAVPPNAVALVNQRLVLQSDFRTQVEVLHGVPFDAATPAQRREVLESMVAEELLVQRGLEIGLPATDPDVREALVGAVRLQIGLPLRAQEPSTEQLRGYFDAHHDQFLSAGRIRVRDLQWPLDPGTPAEAGLARARSLVAALRSGTDPQQIIERFGLRESPRVGGEDQLDVAARAALGDTLFTVAAKLAPGEVSEPVRQADVIHVLVGVSRNAPVLQAFDVARAQVLAAWKRDAQERAQREYLAFLRGKAEVLIAAPYRP